MNYIYDITLNFNKDLYEFYEWEQDDIVDFYLKIPIFKIEDTLMVEFINSNFIVSKDFLKKIESKNEVYSKKKKDKYVCIFTSSYKTLAIKFNEHGESILKSNLCIDEEIDVLEYSKLIKYSLVDYKIKERLGKRNKFCTRLENNKKNSVLNIIKKLYINKDFSVLRYIFYEVYNERSYDDKQIYNKLINITENNSNKLDIINNIFDKLKLESKTI